MGRCRSAESASAFRTSKSESERSLWDAVIDAAGAGDPRCRRRPGRWAGTGDHAVRSARRRLRSPSVRSGRPAYCCTSQVSDGPIGPGPAPVEDPTDDSAGCRRIRSPALGKRRASVEGSARGSALTTRFIKGVRPLTSRLPVVRTDSRGRSPLGTGDVHRAPEGRAAAILRRLRRAGGSAA